MFVHIYRHNESDSSGLHQYTPRITMKQAFMNVNEACLVLGTIPNTTVILMKDIRWFWIEED